MRFEAFAYQKFGHQTGHVVQVSRTPLAPAGAGGRLGLPREADGRAEPMFRITVAMDGSQLGGRRATSAGRWSAGMRMQADVLLEKRRLVEWLFEPVLGLSNRL